MKPNYDVVVIGGGIHGAGVAQAAAAAGYSVLALEKTALAAGTSSRSSKLIHGGLRYLESGRLQLVRESLRERALLLRLAPDLVHLTPFYIPVYRTTRRRPWQIAVGLTLYALLGGLTHENRFARVSPNDWPTLDGLTTHDLQCVFRYFDAQTDDAALTRAVMRSAQTLGAELRCPAEFLAAQHKDGSYRVDFLDGRNQITCTATTLINAGGAWTNTILARISPRPPIPAIDLAQGAHIVLDAETHAGVYYVETRDGRAVFVMPWHGKTLVGTTETSFSGDPAQARAQPQEIAYLEQAFRQYFPNNRARVTESFAGLRVLPSGKGDLFHRSREAIFLPDDLDRPRVVTIYGGKLTGYRAAAEHALQLLRTTLPERAPRADTATLPLRDAD